MKNSTLAMIGLCSLMIAGSAYAESQKLPPVINNSTYANGAAYSNQASSNQPMLEMLGQIESLQVEVQMLRGLLEEQSHEIKKVTLRQQNIYTDINARLQQLESGAGISTAAAKTNSNVAPVMVERSNLASAKPNQDNLGQLSPVNPLKSFSKAEEKAAFDKAFLSVKNSRYQQSIMLLEQFLKDFPNGSYTDNAYFWLGSVYKVVNNTPDAITNFEQVYTQFPQSEKAGMAMLKLADIYKEGSHMDKAQQLYTQITRQYADSTAAHMAGNKLQIMGQ